MSIEDTSGNSQFIPFFSNITDVSLISVDWNDIKLKPGFCNLVFSGSYNDLINKPLFVTIATSGNYNDLNTNKIWTFDNNNIYNITGNVGIGNSNPQYKLDVAGNINFNGSLYQNGSQYQNSQWITANPNIYYNLGNIGIGKTTNILESLDINGNIRIEGTIYPNSTNNYDLGTSNKRWKDIYLSGNSIYLDNLVISKNTSSNNIQIKDSNNNYTSLIINQINLNSNNNNLNLSLNNNGDLIYTANNNIYYPLLFDNSYDYSNIVLSNVFLATSNFLNNKIANLSTDTIIIGDNNRFITNDIYNRDITFTQNLTASNVTTSNLTIIGDTTVLNTIVYQTEQLQVINDTTATPFIIKQLNANYNIAEFYNNTQLTFLINSNGYVGVSKNNPLYQIDINGSLNTNEAILIKDTNISNIIDIKISANSNKLIDYNNHINKPSLSSVSLSGDYNDLNNKHWINDNNNIYNTNSGFVGIGTNNPQYKLDINGETNTNETILINGINISNIIDTKISDNGVYLSEYANHINKYVLATVATSGSFYDINNRPNQYGEYSNYNNLINTNWSNNGNNIYNKNSGFIGINNNNPLYTLDINGETNSSEVLIKGLNISNIIDTKISVNSNSVIDYNNHINKPVLTTIALTGSYNDLTNKPSLATVATSGNYNDLINTTWITTGNNIYNNNSAFVGIGTNNPLYKLDIYGDVNINNEVFIKNVNISNIIDSNLLITSNDINTKINAIITDTITLGTNNRFITNDIYNRDITFTQILTSSNIITSNLSVLGDTTTIDTTVYQTKQLQVINNTTYPALIVKQINATQNVFESYSNSQLVFIINSAGNIGVSKTNPTYKFDINGSLNTNELLIKGLNISNVIDNKITVNSNLLVDYTNHINKPVLASVATTGNYDDLINNIWTNGTNNNIYNTNSGFIGIGKTNPEYKLDVTGDINSTEIFIKNTNISNVIDNKILITSNILINYNNFINKLVLSTVATSGDYTNLINKPAGAVSDFNQLSNNTWINSGTNIYNSNSLNVGIGKTNPQYKLDVIGDINYTGSLRISNAIIPFSTYSNTNIIASNATFSYSNSSYGYYTFLTNGSITFPQNTNCDILVVGAGGNGGLTTGGGGGGAGEVIYYPNYPFTSGTSNITVGYSSSNTIARISKINNSIIANGGSDGNNVINIFNNTTNCNIPYNSIISFNYDNYININSGSYNITFSSGNISFGLINNSNYPILKDTTNNVINPSFWCKFDTSTYTNDITNNIYTSNSSYIYNNTSNYIKGNGSLGITRMTMTPGYLTSIINFIIPFSICFWVYITTNQLCQIFGINIINSSPGINCEYNGSSSITTYINFQTLPTSWSLALSSTTTININNWYYISVLFSNTNPITVYFYINGVLQSSGSGIINTGFINNKNILIGIGGDIALTKPFGGFIDDFRIYNKLLLSTEISELFKGRISILLNSTNSNYTERITGTNLIVGSSGINSNSIPVLRTTYGSGGDANNGLGTQGIVIVKVPLNTTRTKFDGYINYSNIDNRPYINDVVMSKNFIDIGYYNQVNFPLANISLANEWFVYKGTSPSNTSNSLIFWHINSNVNSKWWFNGTINNTNNEISDERVKKEIRSIINPLEKFMLLEPKEYMLCDDKDYVKKYGLIAQEVKQTLPEFVYTDEDYIANVYTNAIYNEILINNNYCYTLKTTININSLIAINDELKILLNNNDNKNKEIIIEDLPYHNRHKKRFAVVKAIIDNNTIEITEKLELTEIEKLNVFIYGKKVKDFLKLDYSSLYTLSIASTQNLYNIYLQQQKKLLELNQRLETYNNSSNV